MLSLRVVVDRCAGGTVGVTSGVPQGSVLGPLLFLVFINHVCAGLECTFFLFADDLKLLKCVDGCKSSSLGTLQSDIDLLFARSTSWGLKFSVSKCARLNFNRSRSGPSIPLYFLGNDPVPNASSYRDLGVTVDVSLRFHPHVREIYGKASGVAQSILRGTVCRSPEFLMKAFLFHVRPILDFASVIWCTGYVGDMLLLESVQRRFTKRIEGFWNLSYGDRLLTLDLFSIKGRLLRNDLVMVWKIFQGLCPGLEDFFVLVPSRSLRGHPRKIFVLHCHTNARSRFFGVRIINV